MAIFNEINKRSGVVVVTVIAALAMFLLTDLFFGQNSILRSSDNKVGEIAGEKIGAEEYQRQLSIAERNYTMQYNRSVSENERSMMHDNAWNQLIFEYGYREQFEEIGLLVTDEEWADLTKGDFIHPMVRQLFGNPETFSKDMVNNFLANLAQYPQQDQFLWYYVDTQIPEIRLREKYSNLLKKTEYVTTAEAKRDYLATNQKASINFVNVPFSAIPDSAVKITDSELKRYLDQHKNAYKREESRSLDYVVFAVHPSKEDSLALSRDLESIAAEFKNAADDSTFVLFNSDEPAQVRYTRMGELAEGLQNAGNLEAGNVYGPYLTNGSFKLYKVVGSKEDSVYSARASHILFRFNGEEEKADARKKAQEVLNAIRNGASFEEMAAEHGTDATSVRGGDLGWFSEGAMVGPFNDAIFGSARSGLLTNLVETQFGFHIVKITEPRTRKMYKVAEVSRVVDYSEETKDQMYQEALEFANDIKDSSDFYAKIKEHGNLTVNAATNLRPIERNLNSIRNARDIIRWAFNDAKPGDVSEVKSIDNQFIVAVVTDAREAGTADLDEVRSEITDKVRLEKKGEQIKNKLDGITGSLQEIAASYGGDANFGNAADITLAGNYVSGVGYDPILVGRTFGLKVNGKSQPVIGQSSVSIIELTNIGEVQEIADYAANKNRIAQQRSSRADFLISEVIKKASDIKDKRYKFF